MTPVLFVVLFREAERYALPRGTVATRELCTSARVVVLFQCIRCSLSHTLRRLRLSPEFLQRRSLLFVLVAKEEVPDFVGPDAAAYAGVPAHGVAEFGVGVGQHSPEGAGAQLQDGFHELDPEEYAPGRQVSGGEGLVLVVPAAAVELDDVAGGGEGEELRPAVGGDVEELDLVGVVGEEVAQRLPVVPVALFFEADDVGGHGDDVVLAEQLDGFAVFVDSGAFLDRTQGFLAVALGAEEEADEASLFVEVEDVAVANDVVGAGGTDEGDGEVVGDEGFEEGAPGGFGGGGVLVGEVEELDAVFAVEPGDFGGELFRVAVTPAPPEFALAAVIAEVGAAAGELDDHGAASAPVAVVFEVDELPADAVVVEALDDRGAGRGDGAPLAPESDTG